MRGITRRGKRSWRLKYDVERVAGARQIHYVTVKGHPQRRGAPARQARATPSTPAPHVDPAEITVGAWLHKWLAGATVSPRFA